MGGLLRSSLGVAFLSSCLSSARARRPQVVFSSDSGQFEGMAAAISSMLTASEEEISFTIVTNANETARAGAMAKCAGARHVRVVGWEHTNVTRLPKLSRGDFYDPRHRHVSMNQRQDLASVLNYVRFYLPELGLDDDGIVLYLDSDVVVRCDVAHFLKRCRKEFDEHAEATILVAQRGTNKRRRRRRLVVGSKQKLEDHEAIFNAGVFVADLARWRQRDATGRLERAVRDVAEMVHVNITA